MRLARPNGPERGCARSVNRSGCGRAAAGLRHSRAPRIVSQPDKHGSFKASAENSEPVLDGGRRDPQDHPPPVAGLLPAEGMSNALKKMHSIFKRITVSLVMTVFLVVMAAGCVTGGASGQGGGPRISGYVDTSVGTGF